MPRKIALFLTALGLVACGHSVGDSPVPAEPDAALRPDVPAHEAAVPEAQAQYVGMRTPEPPSFFSSVVDAGRDREAAVPVSMDVPHETGSDAGVTISDASPIPDAEARASSLIVSLVPLTFPPLTRAPQVVMLLHLASSGDRPVTIKRLGYIVEVIDATGDAVPSTIAIMSGERPLPVEVRTIPERPSQAMRVAVVFSDERIVYRDGSDVSLVVGLSREPVPGDRLRVTAQIRPGPSFGAERRGFLTPVSVSALLHEGYGPHVYDGVGPCEKFRLPLYPDRGNVSFGFVVWSSLTDRDHSDRDCMSGGSSDWFNGAMPPPGVPAISYETNLRR